MSAGGFARAARRRAASFAAGSEPLPPPRQKHRVKSVPSYWHGRLVLHKPKPARQAGTAPAAPKREHVKASKESG